MIAGEQARIVHGRQLARVGFTPRMIAARVERGILHRRHRGVYVWGTPDVSPRGAMIAAVLATWPHGGLGLHAAAHLYDASRTSLLVVDVVLPTSRSRDDPLLRFHRRARPTFTRRHGLAVTPPLDTIFDLATVMGLDDLEWTIAEMRFRGHVTDAELDAAAERGKKRGVARVREVLGREGGAARTPSNGERLLLKYFRQADLGPFEVNHSRGPTTPDFVFTESGVRVELDHPASHGFRRAFERDRRKDLDAMKDAELTLRPTTHLVETEPFFVIARVAAALAVARTAH